MSQKTFNLVAGIIFLIVAVVHLWRIANHMPVAFGTTFIPESASYAAIVVAGFLAYTGLRRR